MFRGFPGGSDSKNPACSAEDLCSVPGLGRSLGGGHGNPIQYSWLENPHGRRCLAGYSPWGRTESDTAKHSTGVLVVKNPPASTETRETWVRSLGWEGPLEEKMATHSSFLAWRITWTEEPGGLQSMGLQRVGHN